ncbi:MAG: hypothetical protein ACL7AX_08660 [Candidatus Arsenophonus phytopathogenicus]
MGEENLMLAIRRLIIGDNKVCGLTRPQDAQSAYQVGAIYGGLIFADKSPRKVTLEQARAVIAAAPLNYVDVFQHQVNSLIAKISHQLNLFAVQLHGYKTASDIQQLRSLLLANCEIWQAVNMLNHHLVSTQKISIAIYLIMVKVAQAKLLTGPNYLRNILIKLC